MIYDYFQMFIFAGLVMVSLFAASEFFTSKNRWNKRVKAVVEERRRIREKVRDRESGITEDVGELEKFGKSLLDQLRIERLFNVEETKAKLREAGKRSRSDLIRFLFFRAISPIAGMGFVFLYLTVVSDDFDLEFVNWLFFIFLGFVLGFFAPTMILNDRIKQRRQKLREVFPDMLDLLIMCLESGSSIEASIARVSQEIGIQSVDMAEEMMLTAAELSYLNDRRLAYENLANRTGVDGVKAVTAALIQAERYGTSLGKTLRVIASDFRRNRLIEAEKKAAAASAKMTLPMVMGFLPILFVIIFTPAYIRYTEIQ